MSGRPITEDDLHAYVDRALDFVRHAEVATYLASHPDVAERVEGFSRQREMLRSALAPIAEEPIPPQLNLLRILEARRKYRASAWRMAAAAVILCIGGFGGWWLRGMELSASDGIAALAQEAANTYSVYAMDHVQPVEMGASDQLRFADWVSQRLHEPVKVPDLSSSGYRLMGGRLVATSRGPAAMLMYDDDRGTRLVILTRPMVSDQNAPMLLRSRGTVNGFTWADGGIGYSLVGATAPDILRPIANEVRRKVRPI
jgi:anti-sigma factor RsiW